MQLISKVLKSMETYIPLMQTFIWAVLIISGFFIFRKQLKTIINILICRLDAGAPLKVWGLEFGITPSSPVDREKKLMKEASDNKNGRQATSRKKSNPRSARQLFNRQAMAPYILAEEFALSNIAKELNTNIERDIKASQSPFHVFDGVALLNQQFIAIEVKYLKNPIVNIELYRKTLGRISSFYSSLDKANRKHFSLIFAVVIDSNNVISVDEVLKKLMPLKASIDYRIDFRVYVADNTED